LADGRGPETLKRTSGSCQSSICLICRILLNRIEMDIEFSPLVEWLGTFALESKASITSELSDGLALSEALVQIEPSFFTPSWFAGILHSKNSNNENLTLILNMILHYYRQNLGDVYTSGDLLLPEVAPGCEELCSEMIARFLRLMLGIAVTCSNKQTFIAKIQNLEETTQHALTACVASFIFTKDWAGRQSAQSINSELKAITPPGDEVWAQKCHELDFQVALLKEERSNLVCENEDLYGKVKEALTLSRKDSVKAKQFESEVEDLKDEFDRLRMAYEGTREYIENIEKRIKPEEKDQSEILRLSAETAALKSELVKLKTILSKRTTEKPGSIEEGEILHRLQEQQEEINVLRDMVEYQASLQGGLLREVDCLKDQVDVLREQVHNHNKYEQELSDVRVRLQDCLQQKESLTGIIQMQSLTNLQRENCNGDKSNSNELLDHSYSVSQTNLQEEEEAKTPVKVVKKKLSREANVLSDASESEHIYVNNYNYLHTNEPSRLVQSSSESKQSPCDSDRDQLCSNESDSGLDVTPEGTPFTSRPESELLINDEKGEDEIKASPRQLEMLMEDINLPKPPENEPSYPAVEELLRVLSDPNLAISVDEIEAIVSGKENLKHNEIPADQSPRCHHSSGHIDQADLQLFDPNDPKVKDLEEWNCSIHERSVLDEETPKRTRSLRKVFSMRKKVRKTVEERKLLSENYSLRGSFRNTYREESISMECLKSWLLQIFVKVFD